MEGFELIATGLWSIVPPILALVLALITKEVYSSLTIGVFTGMIIYQFTLNGVGGEQLVASFTMVPQMMAEQIAGNGALLLFLALLGALTVVIATAGGSRAYAEWVTTHVKNARAASILTALLGIIIFVDDYFNCLTVGAVMRPVTDKFRVSHEKLAWIIDSTAAPVCIIAPVSSWAVAVGGYMGEDGFNTFVASIPYNFYALLTIFFVFFMLFLQKDFGPMAAAQADAEGRIPAEGSALEAVSLARIADKAQVDLEGAPNIPTVVTEEGDIDDAAAGAIEEYKGLNISDRGTIWDLIVPILVLIVFSILFGFSVQMTGGKDSSIGKWLAGLSDVMMKFVQIITYYAPIAFFAIFADLVATYGSEVAKGYGRALLVYYPLCFIYIFTAFPLFAWFGGGKGAVGIMFKHIARPAVVSLGTCSSVATIPTNMEEAVETGVSKDIAGMVLPLGATMHMDGSCFSCVLKIAFVLGVFGEQLSWSRLPFIVLVAVLSSVGMSGVPGGGYIGEYIICSIFFPTQMELAFPILVAIGNLVDPPATMINSAGDYVVSYIVSRFVEGKDWLQKQLNNA